MSNSGPLGTRGASVSDRRPHHAEQMHVDLCNSLPMMVAQRQQTFASIQRAGSIADCNAILLCVLSNTHIERKMILPIQERLEIAECHNNKIILRTAEKTAL